MTQEIRRSSEVWHAPSAAGARNGCGSFANGCGSYTNGCGSFQGCGHPSKGLSHKGATVQSAWAAARVVLG
jgi:hypothetical protein